MTINFDQTPPRKDTYSFKWQKYKGKDIIPAWVADTEFRCAQPILDAISAQVIWAPGAFVPPQAGHAAKTKSLLPVQFTVIVVAPTWAVTLYQPSSRSLPPAAAEHDPSTSAPLEYPPERE